jgi:tRNA-5-taurinomethyluridine 2-sulfurtransferase
MKRIVCAISGGVDSAVAAYLLKKSGYEVVGLFMRNWSLEDEQINGCTQGADQQDAEYVCRILRIPFVCADFTKTYWNKVFR